MSSISSYYSFPTSVDEYVEQALVTERANITTLENKKTDLNSKSSVYTDLSTNLKSLQDIADEFSSTISLNSLVAKSAVSSDESYIKVNASNNAETGSYSIRVNSIARTDIAHSSRFSSDGSELGDHGNQEIKIAAGDGEYVSLKIDIKKSDTNKEVLQKVADAINDADVSISASVIDDTSDTSRLTITSKETGSDNRINIGDEKNNELFAVLGILDSEEGRKEASGTNGGFLIQNSEELNAEFMLNGLEIIRQSNTVDDVIDGVTLSLYSASEDTDREGYISVENDIDEVKEQINSFIETYNKTITYLRDKTSFDTSTNTHSDLYGDTSLSTLRYLLSDIVTGQINSEDGSDLNTLAVIGITIERSGELTISDQDKLDENLEGDLNSVISLFQGKEGVGEKIEGLMKRYTRSGGVISSKKNSISEQVNNLDTRISSYEKILEKREASLKLEYSKLQQMLISLNNQMDMFKNNSFILDTYF
ncbi:MAG: flagellar filament capping protein FliD [bacterium]|nr:flagellar filament capping protein FliD [bacterium]